MVPGVLQITENELCREHRNHIKKNHFHDHQENFCVLLCFQSFLVCAKHFLKIFFLTIKATFIQVAFKNIQGLLWKIQGLFKARAKKGLTESEVWRKVLSNNVIVTL